MGRETGDVRHAGLAERGAAVAVELVGAREGDCDAAAGIHKAPWPQL